MRWALMGVLCASCVPRQTRFEAMVDAGWASQAKVDARWRELDEVHEAIWSRTDLTVSMEVVPVEDFGLPPRGYGTEWWLVSVGFDRRERITPSATLDVTFDTLTVCSTCDANWMKLQMAPVGTPPHYTPSSGSGRRHRRGLGKLFGDLLELGKAVGTAVFMPLALVTDIGLTLSGLPLISDYKPMGLTQFTWNLASSPGGVAHRPVGAAVPVPDKGLRCSNDGPCAGMFVVKGSEPPTSATVTVELDMRYGELVRSVPVSLQGQTVAEAVQSGFPSEGVRIDLGGTP